MAQVGGDGRFVVGCPKLGAVAVGARDDVGVVGELIHDGAFAPGTFVLQHPGVVPVVQRDERGDTGFQQAVDEA